jgi:tRNA splicing endonuclease
MEREVIATFRAATAKPDYLTTEKFDAMLGGWGVFNLGVWAAANVIAKEMQKGKKLKLEVTNEAYTDVDEIAKKAVKKLMECGADPANASLATAGLLYWAGVNAQCGIPCPNRKLGAVTRMAAGIPSGRVSSIPTEKLNNKVSGFAATLAIYQALDKEHLAPFDSGLLPLGIGGSPFVGHTALGEDHLFPKLGQKLARIGTRAMMKAYESAGMRTCRWMSGLLGTAAALEIIHPDAYVGEEYGQFLVTRTPEVAAAAAVEEAGMPDVIHIRGTNEELKTARVLGDLALILKDCGTPTVVGMIMFNEICSVIKEGAALGVGRAGGPLLLPLNHWVTSPSLALYLLGKGATQDEIIAIIKETMNGFFQKEDATVATNILARRAEFIERGPLTDAIIRATEPGMTNSITKRATYAYEQMKGGKTLPELLEDVQKKHIDNIATSVAKGMSKVLNKNIEYIKFKDVRPGAGRRTHKFAQKYFAFDAYVDVEVKIDGKVYELENVLAKAAPEAILKGDRETINALAAVGMAITELLNAGACSMDVVVCACMAAAMGMDPLEAAEKAAEVANVIISMPSPSLKKAAQLASDIMKGLDF